MKQFFKFMFASMALAHNGNLTNAHELREELELQGSIFQTTSDTEVIAYIIVQERLKQPSIEEAVYAAMVYALPGNGGIAADAVCVDIGAKDISAIVDFANSHAVDFAVVAPDDPLALGCVDRLHEAGISCFGPDAKAARIESSKVFSKNLMRCAGPGR